MRVLKIMKKGLTLPEVIISSALALFIMLILLLSINKMEFVMRKLATKYYVVSTTKNILIKLSNYIVRNSNFNSSQSAVFEINKNRIGFTTNTINQVGSTVIVSTFFNYLIIEKTTIKNRPQTRDYSFKIRRIIYEDRNNNMVLDTNDPRNEEIINLGIIENVVDSELYFENRSANLIRICLNTVFLFRTQRSRIIYYLDMPINSK